MVSSMHILRTLNNKNNFKDKNLTYKHTGNKKNDYSLSQIYKFKISGIL